VSAPPQESRYLIELHIGKVLLRGVMHSYLSPADFRIFLEHYIATAPPFCALFIQPIVGWTELQSAATADPNLAEIKKLNLAEIKIETAPGSLPET